MKKKNKAKIILILVLLLCNGLFGYLWRKSEKEKTKDDLASEEIINNLYQEIGVLQGTIEDYTETISLSGDKLNLPTWHIKAYALPRYCH